jgi:hypothetical protein
MEEKQTKEEAANSLKKKDTSSLHIRVALSEV